MTVSKFVIDRAKWYRGCPVGSLLLRQDGRQCCVGLYLTSCGLPDADLLQRAVAGDVGVLAPKWLQDAEFDGCLLYSVNDNSELTEPEREAEVARLFRELGNVEVEFIGGES
jgi:hypothetical protein